MDYRWAGGNLERLDGLAVELAGPKPDVIVAVSEPAAIAAKRATTTIPIVMPICGDPIAAGLAVTLSHPGGNVTGLSQLKPEITPKYLELLREVQPKLRRTGLFFDETRASDKIALQELRQASNVIGVDLYLADARTPDRYAVAFETLVKNRIEGLIVLASAATYLHRQLIINLALRQRIPTISGLSEFARAGALMTYGPNQRAMFGRSASYIAKILQGTSPADLPIEQPTHRCRPARCSPARPRQTFSARFSARGPHRGSTALEVVVLVGAPGRSRTCDPRIRSPMLYPTELQARQVVTIHQRRAD